MAASRQEMVYTHAWTTCGDAAGLSADSEWYLCVDGDVCTCDGTGLSNQEGVDRDGASLSVIREGDENGSGNRQNGSDSLGDNDRRGLNGRRRGQGTGAGDGDGGMGDRDGSGRWSRAGGESGRSSGGGRVKVCMYSELQSNEKPSNLTIFIAVIVPVPDRVADLEVGVAVALGVLKMGVVLKTVMMS